MVLRGALESNTLASAMRGSQLLLASLLQLQHGLSWAGCGTVGVKHAFLTEDHHAVRFEQFVLLRVQPVIPTESWLFARIVVVMMNSVGLLLDQLGYVADLRLPQTA